MKTSPISARTIALALLLGMGCSSNGPEGVIAPRRQDMNGGFSYRAFASNSALLLIGTVQLMLRDDGSITGSWDIDWAPGADRSATVGPQVGTGSIGGQYRDEEAFIDLNPGWADNNVFLMANAVTNGNLTGEWHHSTFVGPVAEGRFELRRLGP